MVEDAFAAAMLARLEPLIEDKLRPVVDLLRIVEKRLPPNLGTVARAAEIRDVSVPTMRRWIKAGKVATVGTGRSLRVDLSKIYSVDGDQVAQLAGAARLRAVGGAR